MRRRCCPATTRAEGFDNIASVLSVSPALMQAYVTAAAKISRLAVGDPTTSPGITTYRAPRGLSQAEHREGQPLGTRGGIVVRHVFPLDADYDFRVGRTGSGFGLTAVGGDEQLEITLDGERLRLLGRDARGRAAQGSRGTAQRRRGRGAQGERARRGRPVRRVAR